MSSNVIYRGTLTKGKLVELAKEHLGFAEKEVPHNPNEVKLVKQDDGNWKGWGYFQGSWKTARSFGPDSVLQMLITGQGDTV